MLIGGQPYDNWHLMVRKKTGEANEKISKISKMVYYFNIINFYSDFYIYVWLFLVARKARNTTRKKSK